MLRTSAATPTAKEWFLIALLRGPVNSPPEAGSIRHPRPVETATPGRRHRAVRRGKLPLTNNFIWKEEKSSIRIFLL
jgi:hypothetical protein